MPCHTRSETEYFWKSSDVCSKCKYVRSWEDTCLPSTRFYFAYTPKAVGTLELGQGFDSKQQQLIYELYVNGKSLNIDYGLIL